MKTPTPRLAAALACTLLFAFYPLSAQLDTDAAPKSPPITASFAADYRYSSYLPPEEAGDRWRSAQSASFEARARAGNLFSFSARVETDGKPGSFDPDAAIETLSLAFSPSPACTLTAGKQNLQWGTARAFSSITRLAPPVDPLEPEGSSRSVTGVRADLIPAWWLSLTGVALPGSVPGSPADETTGALRAELLVLDTDVAVGLISQIGAGGDRETAVIGDAARFFAFFGLYGEGQYVIDGASDTQITGGLRLDIPAWLDSTIVTSAEYQWLPENTDSEHRVFLDISGIPLSRDLRAGISALAAPDASLIVFRGTVRWNVNQNLDAALSGRYQCYTKDAPAPVWWGASRAEISASVSAAF
ncbi:MAG: hypothetical protein EWM51_02375 [Treponema sp.]|nr:MAG: hypothetical protein EWM51_02375 [Treponema sp.]